MCSMCLDCRLSQKCESSSPWQRELFHCRSWATWLTSLNLGTFHNIYLCALLLCSGDHVVCSYSCCFVLLFFSVIHLTETPTCLCLCLERLSVSFCLPGLSSCPTQMDRTIRSCLLASVTTRASRHSSAPFGPNTCQFWAPLQVSDTLPFVWTVQGVASLPKVPAGHVTSCQIWIFILSFLMVVLYPHSSFSFRKIHVQKFSWRE